MIMSPKYRKILIAACCVFLVTTLTPLLFMAIKSNPMKKDSGNYYYNVDIDGENGNKSETWELSIRDGEVIHNIKETEENSLYLNEFRNSVNKISMEKLTMLMRVIYLLVCIAVYVCINNSFEPLFTKREKRNAKIMIALIMALIFITMVFSIIAQNGYCNDAIYLYKLIS